MKTKKNSTIKKNFLPFLFTISYFMLFLFFSTGSKVSAQYNGLSSDGIEDILERLLIFLSWTVGGIFVAMMIIGGIMMSIGSATGNENGKKIIQWTIIGGVVALGSGILFYLIKSFLGATA